VLDWESYGVPLKVHFATVRPPTTVTARTKYPRIKHDAESLKYSYQYDRGVVTGSNLELLTDLVFLVGIGWYFPGIYHEGEAYLW
jgi:hypothetical protein